MENNKKGSDGIFKVNRYEVKRENIDTKKLKELYPKTYEDVLKGTTSYINMRILSVNRRNRKW